MFILALVVCFTVMGIRQKEKSKYIGHKKMAREEEEARKRSSLYKAIYKASKFKITISCTGTCVCFGWFF